MFGIGFSELIILGILALVLIGPKDLPVLARTLGRFLNDLKRGADGFKDEFFNMKEQDEYRKHIQSHHNALSENNQWNKSDTNNEVEKNNPTNPNPNPTAAETNADTNNNESKVNRG